MPSVKYTAKDEISFNYPSLSLAYQKREMSLTGLRFYPMKWHDEIEIKLFYAEGASVECENEVFSPKPGDVIVINPAERHSTRYISGAPVYKTLIFDARFYEIFAHGTGEMPKITPPVFNNFIQGDAELTEILEEIFSELDKSDFGYELAVKGLIYKLLAFLCRRQQKTTTAENRKTRRASERIAPALEYIDLHLNDDISLDKLALSCHLNRFYFCDLFRYVTGYTASIYIQLCKIRQAQLLLTDTDKPIKEIAEASGFNDICYFNRCFKKHTGMTPLGFRTSFHVKPNNQIKG